MSSSERVRLQLYEDMFASVGSNFKPPVTGDLVFRVLRAGF
jgi:hypothetical protein